MQLDSKPLQTATPYALLVRLPSLTQRVSDTNNGIVPRRLWLLAVFLVLVLLVSAIAIWGFYRVDTDASLGNPLREVGVGLAPYAAVARG